MGFSIVDIDIEKIYIIGTLNSKCKVRTAINCKGMRKLNKYFVNILETRYKIGTQFS